MEKLRVNNIKKVYTTLLGNNSVQALTNITFDVMEGEFVAIMGESGSGKTTLLNITATLDKPTSGEIYLGGKSITDITEKAVSAFRRDNLGFVFQDFNLLDNFNIKDNILLPLVLKGMKYDDMEVLLNTVVNKLHIGDLTEKFPYEISGGQKQRTAIARAIITKPQLILADEPTGSLDSHAADSILEIFQELNTDGHTILMVTHSVKAASRASRVLFLRDGELFHQIYRGDRDDADMHKTISDTLVLLAAGGDRA